MSRKRRKYQSKTPPDPEVQTKAQRRQFSAAYKKKILEEINNCTEEGEIGAILRREGLYSSHLTTWRRQQENGMIAGLSPKKRGRKEKPHNPLVQRVQELEQENKRLNKRIEQAETIIEFQKKLSMMLGSLSENQSDEKS